MASWSSSTEVEDVVPFQEDQHERYQEEGARTSGLFIRDQDEEPQEAPGRGGFFHSISHFRFRQHRWCHIGGPRAVSWWGVKTSSEGRSLDGSTKSRRETIMSSTTREISTTTTTVSTTRNNNNEGGLVPADDTPSSRPPVVREDNNNKRNNNNKREAVVLSTYFSPPTARVLDESRRGDVPCEEDHVDYNVEHEEHLRSPRSVFNRSSFKTSPFKTSPFKASPFKSPGKRSPGKSPGKRSPVKSSVKSPVKLPSLFSSWDPGK